MTRVEPSTILAPESPVAEVTGVRRHYHTRGGLVSALDGISLSVGRKEFLAIAGPSGSGKTTLLNLIGALDRPSAGVVQVDGRDLSRLTVRQLAELRRHRIGFVFQNHNLIPVLTVFENVEYPLILLGVAPRERRERVRATLAELAIDGLAGRRPGELSGGQQQRAAVARAIVSRPALVLADEPTASLDSAAGAALLDAMDRLNGRQGITFVFSTHDPMIMARSSRLVRLRDGRIEAGAS